MNPIRYLALIMTMVILGSIYLSNETNGEIILVTSNDDKSTNHIQNAINGSNNGDIIQIYPGKYYGNIIVNRSISIIGNNSESVIIYGTLNNNTITINSNNVTIAGLSLIGELINFTHGIDINKQFDITIFDMNISNYDVGIKVNESKNIYIANNKLINNSIGIGILESIESSVIKNNCSNNLLYGIIISHNSSNIGVEENLCNNNKYGLIISNSYNLTIINNKLSNNKITGISIGSSLNNNFIGNDCTNNDFGIIITDSYENTFLDSAIINNQHTGVSLFKSDNNVFSNLSIIESYIGIRFVESDLNKIFNSTISHNEKGILILYTSELNRLFYNNIEDNNILGVDGEKSFRDSINLKHNWWGDSSGPYNGLNNKNGLGNPVTNNIQFTPWLLIQNENEKPDILFANISILGNRLLTLSNQKVTVRIQIINAGLRDALPSIMAIYENNLSIETIEIPLLKPEQQFNITYDHNPSSIGLLQLKFSLDITNQIIESDEQNNIQILTITSIKRISDTPSFSMSFSLFFLSAIISMILSRKPSN